VADCVAWFPASLPTHCKLVASVVQSHDVLISRLRSLTSNMLHVGELGPTLAMKVLTSWLTNAGRTVTADQRDIIQTALYKYITHTLHSQHSSLFSSYTPRCPSRLPRSSSSSSYKFLALISSLVLSESLYLPQLFETPLRTNQFIQYIQFFPCHLKAHIFQAALNALQRQNTALPICLCDK